MNSISGWIRPVSQKELPQSAPALPSAKQNSLWDRISVIAKSAIAGAVLVGAVGLLAGGLAGGWLVVPMVIGLGAGIALGAVAGVSLLAAKRFCQAAPTRDICQAAPTRDNGEAYTTYSTNLDLKKQAYQANAEKYQKQEGNDTISFINTATFYKKDKNEEGFTLDEKLIKDELSKKEVTFTAIPASKTTLPSSTIRLENNCTYITVCGMGQHRSIVAAQAIEDVLNTNNVNTSNVAPFVLSNNNIRAMYWGDAYTAVESTESMACQFTKNLVPRPNNPTLASIKTFMLEQIKQGKKIHVISFVDNNSPLLLALLHLSNMDDFKENQSKILVTITPMGDMFGSADKCNTLHLLRSDETSTRDKKPEEQLASDRYTMAKQVNDGTVDIRWTGWLEEMRKHFEPPSS